MSLSVIFSEQQKNQLISVVSQRQLDQKRYDCSEQNNSITNHPLAQDATFQRTDEGSKATSGGEIVVSGLNEWQEDRKKEGLRESQINVLQEKNLKVQDEINDIMLQQQPPSVTMQLKFVTGNIKAAVKLNQEQQIAQMKNEALNGKNNRLTNQIGSSLVADGNLISSNNFQIKKRNINYEGKANRFDKKEPVTPKGVISIRNANASSDMGENLSIEIKRTKFKEKRQSVGVEPLQKLNEKPGIGDHPLHNNALSHLRAHPKLKIFSHKSGGNQVHQMVGGRDYRHFEVSESHNHHIHNHNQHQIEEAFNVPPGFYSPMKRGPNNRVGSLTIQRVALGQMNPQLYSYVTGGEMNRPQKQYNNNHQKKDHNDFQSTLTEVMTRGKDGDQRHSPKSHFSSSIVRDGMNQQDLLNKNQNFVPQLQLLSIPEGGISPKKKSALTISREAQLIQKTLNNSDDKIRKSVSIAATTPDSERAIIQQKQSVPPSQTHSPTESIGRDNSQTIYDQSVSLHLIQQQPSPQQKSQIQTPQYGVNSNYVVEDQNVSNFHQDHFNHSAMQDIQLPTSATGISRAKQTYFTNRPTTTILRPNRHVKSPLIDLISGQGSDMKLYTGGSDHPEISYQLGAVSQQQMMMLRNMGQSHYDVGYANMPYEYANELGTPSQYIYQVGQKQLHDIIKSEVRGILNYSNMTATYQNPNSELMTPQNNNAKGSTQQRSNSRQKALQGGLKQQSAQLARGIYISNGGTKGGNLNNTATGQAGAISRQRAQSGLKGRSISAMRGGAGAPISQQDLSEGRPVSNGNIQRPRFGMPQTQGKMPHIELTIRDDVSPEYTRASHLMYKTTTHKQRSDINFQYPNDDFKNDIILAVGRDPIQHMRNESFSPVNQEQQRSQIRTYSKNGKSSNQIREPSLHQDFDPKTQPRQIIVASKTPQTIKTEPLNGPAVGGALKVPNSKEAKEWLAFKQNKIVFNSGKIAETANSSKAIVVERENIQGRSGKSGGDAASYNKKIGGAHSQNCSSYSTSMMNPRLVLNQVSDTDSIKIRSCSNYSIIAGSGAPAMNTAQNHQVQKMQDFTTASSTTGQYTQNGNPNISIKAPQESQIGKTTQKDIISAGGNGAGTKNRINATRGQVANHAKKITQQLLESNLDQSNNQVIFEQFEENQESFNDYKPRSGGVSYERSEVATRTLLDFEPLEEVGIDINSFLQSNNQAGQKVNGAAADQNDNGQRTPTHSGVDPRLREIFPFMNDAGQISLDTSNQHKFVEQMMILSEKMIILFAEKMSLETRLEVEKQERQKLEAKFDDERIQYGVQISTCQDQIKEISLLQSKLASQARTIADMEKSNKNKKYRKERLENHIKQLKKEHLDEKQELKRQIKEISDVLANKVYKQQLKEKHMMMPIVRAESTVNSNAMQHVIERITNRSQITENITLNLSGDVTQDIPTTPINNLMITSEIKRVMTPTSNHLQPLSGGMIEPMKQFFSITPTNKMAEGGSGFKTLQVPHPQNTVIQRDTFEMAQRLGVSFDNSKKNLKYNPPAMNNYLVPEAHNINEASQANGLNNVTLAIPDLPPTESSFVKESGASEMSNSGRPAMNSAHIDQEVKIEEVKEEEIEPVILPAKSSTQEEQKYNPIGLHQRQLNIPRDHEVKNTQSMILKYKNDVKRDDSYLDMIEDINEDGSKMTKRAFARRHNQLGSSGFQSLIRQRTMRKASSLANQSINTMIKQITQSFIEKLTQNEERHTEIALTQLYQGLIAKGKNFAEMFAHKAYDIKNMKDDHLLKQTVRGETQWLQQQDFFQIVEEELNVKINDQDKTGLVRFCGNITEKTNSILSAVEEENPPFFLSYQKIGVRQLDLFLLDDDNQQSQEIQCSVSREIYDRDKMCRHISEEKLGDYIDAKLAGNPYIASFGTKRRKLPDTVQEIPKMFHNVQLKKNQINEEEENFLDSSDDNNSFRTENDESQTSN
ncbi:hypothetical protein FGO68_gene16970 [Halteria grandinella]|uniref:Uncharacterized protein n=1 Tax=Halteria grandinella TaxID=5974 RepID=A0A8J8P5S2_HALGN|nr:hypothetical protein FGO68_gene16970 [Halteria grandinella]